MSKIGLCRFGTSHLSHLPHLKRLSHLRYKAARLARGYSENPRRLAKMASGVDNTTGPCENVFLLVLSGERRQPILSQRSFGKQRPPGDACRPTFFLYRGGFLWRASVPNVPRPTRTIRHS